MHQIRPAMEEFTKRHHGLYPAETSEAEGWSTRNIYLELTQDGLYAFRDDDHKDGNGALQPHLFDGWKNPIRYRCWKNKPPAQRVGYKHPTNKNTYDLWSAGPDGIFDTADDIGNWQ